MLNLKTFEHLAVFGFVQVSAMPLVESVKLAYLQPLLSGLLELDQITKPNCSLYMQTCSQMQGRGEEQAIQSWQIIG